MLNDNNTHGLWERTAISAPVAPRLTNELTADVAVIGGGITGLSTALHLAAQGAKVVVLESNKVGFGGSGRNVGLVNPGMWVKPDDICSVLGLEAGERLIDVLGAAPRLVFDLIERHGIECEAVHKGTLHCAVGSSGLEEIRDREEQWRRRGAPVRLLDAQETARRTGCSSFSGALLDERAGTIQPLSYTRGLAIVATRLGAQLYTGSEVKSATRVGNQWKLSTDSGSVSADWVVVATNAYSGSLWPALQSEFIPLSYFQCATAPMPSELKRRVLGNGEGLICTRTVITSLRTDAAGRLIFGSLGALRNVGTSVHSRYAKRMLEQMYPELRNVKFENEWFGRIAMTTSHLPRYHELAERVISFHGYNGRGIGTGTMFGKIMAGRILNPSLQPLPLDKTEPELPSLRGVRAGYYEAGSVLAHMF
ncbi:MAG: FAD-binding oxidoreductase [Pseudomonadota bacterium]|jgi:glycine/D-amino acid oxidase-like deaminating enzyme|uniref:NAD(P)/FAD-dependent oxidoreductase n=1 Tax=Burkholderiaceae TaxID=119060 RepID=UPI0010F4BDCD|nr:FAD-binding oxidoreductase [Burkholderia sp. 4M9327F10]